MIKSVLCNMHNVCVRVLVTAICDSVHISHGRSVCVGVSV